LALEFLKEKILLSLPPTVVTGSAAAISRTGATLGASVNPNGATTVPRFQYSTDPSFPLTVGANIGFGYVGPSGVAVYGAGDVFVTDPEVDSVKEVLPDGTIKNIGSGFSLSGGVDVDSAGDVFVVDTYNNALKKVSPDGSITMIGSGLSAPNAVAVDVGGDVFVADFSTGRVAELSPPSIAVMRISRLFNSPGVIS
jgi:hypothetical protein